MVQLYVLLLLTNEKGAIILRIQITIVASILVIALDMMAVCLLSIGLLYVTCLYGLGRGGNVRSYFAGPIQDRA